MCLQTSRTTKHEPMIKNTIIILIALWSTTLTYAQSTEIPALGAQVIIEPAQEVRDVETWFRLLRENKMTVTRIRIFEEHLNQGTENWDFGAYDRAFDLAHENGIKVFATLFPAVDPGNVGGFKFPRTENHQKRIAEYIRQVVTHFKDHPALYAWVLINEPGAGKAPLNEPFTKTKYQRWLANREVSNYDNGYRKEELLPEMFLRDYNTWYLRWLSDEVRRYDTKHPQHANPHMLFNNLPEYDFSQWHPFLSSLGASMHPSWHFGYFNRDQYPMAISANNDIIRAGASPLPFWVTELQGGNNTYSSYYPMNPTQQEIAQWLWTSIGGGAQGIIFWSLNQRATGAEAGEWGMITNYNEPTDRLLMAKKVGETLGSNPSIFGSATPVNSNVHIVYVPEAMITQNRYQVKWAPAPRYAGRSQGACIKSALAYYEALQEMGVSANLVASDDFNWENGKGQVVILANQVALPSRSWDKIDVFVKSGGKLIASGLTGYFDENVHNVMRTGFPLQEVFGAGVNEFKHTEEFFTLTLDDPGVSLPAHLWKGELKLFDAEAIGTEQNIVTASRHRYGKGEVVWIPSLVGLGAWQKDNAPLAQWLSKELSSALESVHFQFARQYPKVLLRLMQSGENYITVLVNTNEEEVEIEMKRPKRLSASLLFSSHNTPVTLTLKPGETQVLLWKK